MLENKPLLRVVICLMIGIVLSEEWQMMVSTWLTVLMLVTVLLTILIHRWPAAQTAGIDLSMILLGAWVMSWHRQSLTFPEEEPPHVIEAVIVSAPIEKERTIAVDVLTTSQRRLKCYVAKDERSRQLRLGDGLWMFSGIKAPENYRSSSFDYRRYLLIHGFTGQCFVRSQQWQHVGGVVDKLPLTERSRLWFLLLRERLFSRYQMSGAEGDVLGALAAMVLGDKQALTPELRHIYSMTGATHVLALSGLHLSIIYVLLSLLVVNRRWRFVSQLFLILSIWTYVLITGLSTSLVRAALMLSLYALFSVGHREKMSVNVLSLAAIVLLILNPYSLFDVSFQLSFMAVLAIVMAVPRMDDLMGRERLSHHPFGNKLWHLLTVSLAAQMGVAPLVAYYFGVFPLCFLLVNVLVIPLVTMILYGALLMLLIPVLAPVVLAMVSMLNSILTTLSHFPFSTLTGLHPTILQVILIYIIICCLWAAWLRMRPLTSYERQKER